MLRLITGLAAMLMLSTATPAAAEIRATFVTLQVPDGVRDGQVQIVPPGSSWQFTLEIDTAQGAQSGWAYPVTVNGPANFQAAQYRWRYFPAGRDEFDNVRARPEVRICNAAIFNAIVGCVKTWFYPATQDEFMLAVDDPHGASPSLISTPHIVVAGGSSTGFVATVTSTWLVIPDEY